VAVRLLHALPPLAVHEPTRRRKKNQWTGWVWNGFLLSSSAVTCKNKKKHKQSFSSFSFFSDLFLPAPFSDLQIFSFFFWVSSSSPLLRVTVSVMGQMETASPATNLSDIWLTGKDHDPDTKLNR
jgi:hypothetical protein